MRRAPVGDTQHTSEQTPLSDDIARADELPLGLDAEAGTPTETAPHERRRRAPANGSATRVDAAYGAAQIQVLEGLAPVRKRPGMYIGSTDARGLHHLVYEIVDNSIDEALAGHCDLIVVTLHTDCSVSVLDNGRGIPVDMHPTQKRSALELVLTVLHAGGKFGEGGYKVSGGLHGVGLSVVNALSERLDAVVHREGHEYTQTYARGVPQGDVARGKRVDDHGTLIRFWPDPEIFPEIAFSWETVSTRLRELAFLNKGVTIQLRDEARDLDYTFHFEGGIQAFVRHLNAGKNPVNARPFYVERDIDKNVVEIALQYQNTTFNEHVLAFANNIHTEEGGSHLTGFRSALTSTLNRYARKAGVLKDNDTNLSGDDVREGLCAILSVKLQDPQFEGQTKTKLGNSEVAGQVSTVLSDALGSYLEENPGDAKRIVEQSLTAQRARTAAARARDLVQRKSALESTTLPGKLADCTEKDPHFCELFIVEGDSAGGCFVGDTAVATVEGRSLTLAQLAADWDQGVRHFGYSTDPHGDVVVVPLVHPRLTRRDAALVEVALDTGEHVRCTPDHLFRLRDGSYRRADALVEGDSLMARFDGDAGRLMEAAQLYNHKVVSVRALDERADVYDLTVEGHENFALDCGIFVHNSAKQGRERRNQAILPLRGKILNVEKARADRVLANEEIRNLILAIGTGFGDAFSLDRLRYHRIVLMVDADVDGSHIRTLLLTFFWRHMTDLVRGGYLYIAQPPLFKLTRGRVTEYAFSDAERDAKMKEMGGRPEVFRYKGLGEMNPDQLWETTMNPEHRVLLKVGVEDVLRADDIFDRLMGSDVEPRKRFIQAHAKSVRNLDI